MYENHSAAHTNEEEKISLSEQHDITGSIKEDRKRRKKTNKNGLLNTFKSSFSSYSFYYWPLNFIIREEIHCQYN